MAERVILPLDDETEDVVLKLSALEAQALHSLLSRLNQNQLIALGLTQEQAGLVNDVSHVCY